VLINLLSNAVKFTPRGGSVTISTRLTPFGLVVAVRDTGIGLAQADIPRAMEAFVQIDDEKSRHLGGTGLGLPITKRLVEMHGGKLTIKSKVNVGTTVIIILPRERLLARREQAVGRPEKPEETLLRA
jgi:signal transduction histidine kinase